MCGCAVTHARAIEAGVQCRHAPAAGGSFHIRALKRALATLGVLLALPYACAPVYQFPLPVAFSGPLLFNPYQDAHGTWQRANFHAHGRATGACDSVPLDLVLNSHQPFQK